MSFTDMGQSDTESETKSYVSQRVLDNLVNGTMLNEENMKEVAAR
jgi:hypothetical protein